ncbi:1993_t:CDS:2 [Entrophospora sp. SA101]|nr:1993_t:CDS:2 [Entrophospora sp. SA101]
MSSYQLYMGKRSETTHPEIITTGPPIQDITEPSARYDSLLNEETKTFDKLQELEKCMFDSGIIDEIESICEIMNAKYTKNVLSVLVKKYKISNTRIYKIWRGQEYYAGLTFKVDQNQNIDWDKEIESMYDLYAELPPELHQSITNLS